MSEGSTRPRPLPRSGRARAALLSALLLAAAGPGTDSVRSAEAGGEGEAGETAPLGREVLEGLTPYGVRVRLWLKKDGEGREPERYNEDRMHERPALLGGFRWDAQTVLLEDPVLQDGFIDRIEVEAGGPPAAARIHAYFRRFRGVLLRADAPLGGGRALAFAPAPPRRKIGALRIADYGWHEGVWTWSLRGAVQGYSLAEDGTGFLWGGAGGLLVDREGRVVGANFRGRYGVDAEGAAEDGPYPWAGSDLRTHPLVTHGEKRAAFDRLSADLATRAPAVRFRFRAEVDEADHARRFRNHRPRFREGRRFGGDEETEARATGFLLDDGRILVPVHLERDLVARLESIEVAYPAEDEPRTARFAGALREVHALLVETDGPPPATGFPLETDGAFRLGEMFLTVNIDVALGKRRERYGYDRYRGLFRGIDGRPGVWTHTNEAVGSLAFDLDERLLAVALASRVPPSVDQYRRGPRATPIFRPLPEVRKLLEAEDAVDPTLRPKPKEEEKRQVWLGVAFQPLNAELAEAMEAGKATRGGRIGLLVTRVYPQSPAAELGLRDEDILLRLRGPDSAEPVELGGSNIRPTHASFDILARIGEESAAAVVRRMPPPWPDRRTQLTRLLTEIGPGREVRLQYLRDGETEEAVFRTATGPADWWSAPTYESEALGLTAKPITYEVRDFLRLPEEAGGVMLARVETGGRADVAGMHAYQRVTHVNGRPIDDLETFRQGLASLDTHGVPEGLSLEFTLSFFGKTRLVKIGFE